MSRFGSRLTQSETWAARMRRWATSARNNNPVELPQLCGAQGWGAAPNWAATTGYVVGNYVNANGQLWVCTGAGTSGSTAPNGTYAPGLVFHDGSAYWLWQPYTAGTYFSNNGGLFVVTTGGLPATSGTGPAITAGAITDGAATVQYVGPQECPVIRYGYTHNAALTQQAGPNLTPANSLIRWRGGIPLQRVSGGAVIGPYYSTYSCDMSPTTGNIVDYPGTGPHYGAGWRGFEVRHEGVLCELEALNNQLARNVAIDGQFIAGVTFQPGGSSIQYMTFDFTNMPRKSRVIMFEGAEIGFQLFSTEPTGSFQKAVRIDDNHCVAGISDSHTFGTGSMSVRSNNYFHTLAHLMGWPDDCCDGISGTGYLAPNIYSPFPARAIGQLQRLVAYGKIIDAIYIAGSQNDSGYTPTQITAAALAFYQALRAAGFGQPLFVVGFPSNAGPSATRIGIESAVAAAVAAQQAFGDNLIWFIPMCSAPQPVTFGNGHLGATNGSGNADFYIGTDGTHLADQYGGTAHVAKYVRDQINVILAGQP